MVSPLVLHAKRILYISPYWPHRHTNASEIRALSIARALKTVGEVEVFVVDGEGGGDEWKAVQHKEFKVAGSATVQHYPNKGVAEKLRWALSPRVDYPTGAGVDRASAERVARLAQDFDLVWFCKLRTAYALPLWSWPNAFADIDDVPSIFEQSVFQWERNIIQRAHAGLRYHSSKRRDQLLGERYGTLGVCSEEDKTHLESLNVKAPIHVIPNGFNRPAHTPVRNLTAEPRLGFVGIFDYHPNLHGIQWFVKECWPLVKKAVPNARLRLVGRCSDGSLKPAGKDIDGLGWVENPDQEMSTWSSMIVPIHLGAGTRGKIAHAFSQKCPVVSTPFGAYGYGARDGREMRLASSAAAFAAACVNTLQKPDEASAMAERAWMQFLEKWTWDAIAPRVWAAAESALQRTGHRSVDMAGRK